MRNTCDSRAVARSSSYGRSVSAGRWAHGEFEALFTVYEEGIATPYPLQVQGTEILMEFIGDGAVAAPRLVQVRCSPRELADYFDQVRQILLGFARVGTARGDLSAYNVLVHHSRVVAIDSPQLVEVISNPGCMELLRRDRRLSHPFMDSLVDPHTGVPQVLLVAPNEGAPPV